MEHNMIIKKTQEYTIESERVDTVHNTAADVTCFFSMIFTLILGFTMVVLTFLGSASNLLVFLFIVNILVFVLSLVFSVPGCGVKIALLHGCSPQSETIYKFTGDPKRDARKIQKIIDNYEFLANHETEVRNKNKAALKAEAEAEVERCCTQYKTVMNLIGEKK